MTNLKERAQVLKSQFFDDVVSLKLEPRASLVEKLRVKWLGKKGELSQLYDDLK